MSEYNRHKWAMEWMHGGGRDPNGRSLDEEIKLGKEEWTERQRVAEGAFAPERIEMPNWRDLIREEGVQVGEQVAEGGRIGLQSGQLVQPGPGRIGLQRGTLASAPWYRGTSGSSGVLKAPRGYTGMADILKHEGAAIGALAINQLNKKKAKEITKGDDVPPVLPPDEPGPGTEIVEDVVTSELIEKWKKKKADEMATKASDEYRMKMKNIKKEKAIKENTISISEGPQFDKRATYTLPYTPKPEVFFPETITYNGETYDAEKFFRDNLIKRATHGTKRKTGKTALTNEALAKLYNTNERQVERAVAIIRASSEWDVKEPPLVDRSIYDVKVRERIANANKNLSPVELENVTIQDKWVWQANQDLGKQSLESIKKNKPQLIDEMQWKLVDGVIELVKRSDEKLTEDLKKFFSVNHNVKRSTEQFNIQTLVNRGLTSKKINSLLNSIEAYIKNNPTHIRKIQNIEKFLSKRGLRVRVDEVSETLLDKLGKKTNFFGADPEGMFNSETGQSIQWEAYLDFLDLALDGPEGVPLIKMAEGGSVPRTGYKTAGLATKALRVLPWLLGPIDIILEAGMALPALAKGNPRMAKRSTTPGVFGSYGGTMLEDIRKYNRSAYRYAKATKDVNEWNALEEDIQRAKKVISGEIGGYPEIAKKDLAEAKKKQALLEKNFSETKEDDFQSFQDTMTQMAKDSREWSGDKNWLGQERGKQVTQESLEAEGVKPIDAYMMMKNADTTDEWRKRAQLEELDTEIAGSMFSPGLDVETFLDPYGLKTQDPRYSDLPTDIASDYGSWEANQAKQKLEQLQNIDPGAAFAGGGIASLLKK